MTRTRGIFGQLAPNAESLETLYTVPPSNTAAVHVIITNRGAQTSFRVSAAVDGAVDDLKQYLAYDKIIDALDTGTTVSFLLGPGDKVRVYAGSANLSFNCTGTEEYK